MFHTPWRAIMLVLLLLVCVPLLATCGSVSASGDVLYVQDVITNAQDYEGQEITVDGAYVWRPDPMISVLALGISTLDSGRDAQPLGDTIWLENFPADVTGQLHRPGDSVYGFVRVTGRLENGAFGPDGSYAYRLDVSQAEPIEQVRYVEHRLEREALGEDKVSFFDLQANPAEYAGQQVTTRGYYFWNTIIWVLAEGISTEEGGGSPQVIGDPIWMEGFPPELSSELNVGAGNTYVWGMIEVTGTFEHNPEGGFGKDGAYTSILTAEPESVSVLETE